MKIDCTHGKSKADYGKDRRRYKMPCSASCVYDKNEVRQVWS